MVLRRISESQNSNKPTFRYKRNELTVFCLQLSEHFDGTGNRQPATGNRDHGY